MTRETIEKYQVWIYLPVLLLGFAVGALAPGGGPFLEALLWPALAALLYTTFTQIPLVRLAHSFRDTRVLVPALIGNFAVLPLFVWGLLALVPDEPAVRLGVLLVLLVPCTDWFIAFTHQAGGDTRRAIALTPAMLLVQIVLLPFYLRLFLGAEIAEAMSATRMTTAFLAVIVLPLGAAWLTERWIRRDARRRIVTERLNTLPVPLLALVLFLVAASQMETVLQSLPQLGAVLAAFLSFLIGAVICAVALSRLFGLAVPEARTLLFSFATRNSFVVLPLALALPPAWHAAAVVIVFQSLIELFAVLALLWLVPRWLMPASGDERSGPPGGR